MTEQKRKVSAPDPIPTPVKAAAPAVAKKPAKAKVTVVKLVACHRNLTNLLNGVRYYCSEPVAFSGDLTKGTWESAQIKAGLLKVYK